MAATDLTTPLNAANVQWKAGADTRQGNLTYENCAMLYDGTVLRIPFGIQEWPNKQIDGTSGGIRVPIPYILESDPSGYTVQSGWDDNVGSAPSGINTGYGSNGIIVEDANLGHGHGPTVLSYIARRSIWVRWRYDVASAASDTTDTFLVYFDGVITITL